MSDRRRAFASAAEGLVGVPFRFRGRDPRTGLDCVGLVKAALEDIGSVVPEMPRYSMRQRSFGSLLDCAAGRGFDETDDALASGDLLLVRPGPGQAHLLIVGLGRSLIHAHAGLGKVVATPMPCPWPIKHHWRLRQH